MTRAAGMRLAIALVAAAIGWRIVEVNLHRYGESNRPRLGFGADTTEAQAREALAANPAELAALLVLAVRREESGARDAASQAYRAALDIAPVDRGALRAAAAFELRAGPTRAALEYLDRLAELHPTTREWAYPLLAAYLGSPDGRQALAAFANRQYMGGFLEYACARGIDARLAVGVLTQRIVAGRARNAEVACSIDRLRVEGRWTEAYQVWLNTLPKARLADVGFVFNGGFEHAPSGLAFDWLYEPQAAAHVVELVSGPGVEGARALRVSYSGKRIAGPAIRQFLALPPGRYAFSGRTRLEGLQSVRGVRWTTRCAQGGKGATLGSSDRFLGTMPWTDFRFALDVPAGCAGQVLELEPIGLGEGTPFVSGRAWFDALRLSRSR